MVWYHELVSGARGGYPRTTDVASIRGADAQHVVLEIHSAIVPSQSKRSSVREAFCESSTFKLVSGVDEGSDVCIAHWHIQLVKIGNHEAETRFPNGVTVMTREESLLVCCSP